MLTSSHRLPVCPKNRNKFRREQIYIWDWWYCECDGDRSAGMERKMNGSQNRTEYLKRTNYHYRLGESAC